MNFSVPSEYTTYQIIRIVRRKDGQMLTDLYRLHREDDDFYISMYQRQQTEMEELMSLDMSSDLNTA
ncbi:MAG: hypothetical protein K9M84_11585 [Spirochaetia bacterium]|nr:hypothetical protein [Spirochaetia bacterium]